MDLKDAMLRHKIFVQRLKHSQLDVITSHLNVLKTRAKAAAMDQMSGRLLIDTLRNSVAGLEDTAIASLADIAEYESEFVAKVANKYLDTKIQSISRSDLETSLKTNNMAINTVKPLASGKITVNQDATKRSLHVAYSQFGKRKADEVAQIITAGQINNTPLAEVSKAINAKIDGYQTAQAKTLAQTSINFSTDLAKMQTFSDNRDIINKSIRWLWAADLEGNVCEHCEELDGNIYSEDDVPDYPQHWNCNCDKIPVEESED